MKYVSLLLVAMLVGCGSDSDGGKKASLEDIVGVWDASETIEQDIDEAYFVINESGESIDYDYDGDAYNAGNNCYRKFSGSTLTDQGNGNFLVTTQVFDEYVVAITLSGESMSISTSTDDGEVISTMTKTTLLESDLTPLCVE